MNTCANCQAGKLYYHCFLFGARHPNSGAVKNKTTSVATSNPTWNAPKTRKGNRIMSDNPANPFILPEGSPLSTFINDDKLPSLPLPTLENTLKKYQESVKPLVTPEEFENTTKIIEEFKNGVGKDLHAKLAEKAANSRNWLEQYWLNSAYLLNRKPLSPFSSFTGTIPADLLGYPTENEVDQIKNGAYHVNILLQFWNILRTERLPPSVISDKKLFDMSQHRGLFNCARIPGQHIDSLAMYFKTEREGDCPSHVILCYKGRFFKIGGNGKILTPPSVAAIIYNIKEKYSEPQPSVAVLTSANRQDWWKYRNKLLSLSERNAASLETLESSVTHLIIDDSRPETAEELAERNFAGYLGDRWFDKSHMSFLYQNGTLAGISEHTPYDGMTGYTLNLFTMAISRATEARWKNEMPTDGSNAGEYEEVIFDIDDEVKDYIQLVTAQSKQNVSLLKPYFPTFTDFGKREMINCRIHPDTFIQMALQLAYVRQHGRPASCYESATTRSFYHGRTETLRSCTAECVEWVNSMLDPKSTFLQRGSKLAAAVMKHTKMMKEACNNEGCDRHLLGLQCIAYEEGLPMPDLYTDPAYIKSGGGANFVLSTSLAGYSKTTAIVAPMITDGYGAFYGISDDSVIFGLSTFTNSTETNCEEFFKNISQSLRDIRDLVIEGQKAGYV